METRKEFDTSFATACFAAACLIGLIGAFVGLDDKSFWVDELYTAGIVEPVGRAGDLFSRIAADLNSPVYFVVLFGYSKLVGTSDAALRSFSALSAVAAVVIFVSATGRTFSLRARLFGGAMATGSFYWFVQAQNARNYALAMLMSTGILVLCLRLAADGRQHDKRGARVLVGLILLMIVATFTHLYLVFESVAALMVLALFRRHLRLLMTATALGLLILSALYVKVFVGRYSQIIMGNYWLTNKVSWYVFQLKVVGVYAFGKIGRATIAFCIAVLVVCKLFVREQQDADPGPRTSLILPHLGPFFPGGIALDEATALLAGVPVLMLLGAVASSLLIAPNFSSRYWLVCAPFLWGLCARLYDTVRTRAPVRLRWTFNIVLSAAVLAMAAIVLDRLRPSTEPLLWSEAFRPSAEWIRTLPDCRDQTIPIVVNDSRAWYKAGYAEDIYTNAYARYLHGFARPQVIYGEDLASGNLPAHLKAELQHRADGKGCPVLGWAAHNMSMEEIPETKRRLLASLDHAPNDLRIETKTFRDGNPAFVIYVNPEPKP